MIQFAVVTDKKNLVNVMVNGKESHWYVKKEGNWYNILWGRADDLLSFRKQSYFSSQSKEEVKEILTECTRKPVEIHYSDRHNLQYVYQGSNHA